jgi:hypothetical protein
VPLGVPLGVVLGVPFGEWSLGEEDNGLSARETGLAGRERSDAPINTERLPELLLRLFSCDLKSSSVCACACACDKEVCVCVCVCV